MTSMNSSTNSVNETHTKKPMYVTKNSMTTLSESSPAITVRSKKTAASYECASDSAHSLRYDAVLETDPSTNSIVSII